MENKNKKIVKKDKKVLKNKQVKNNKIEKIDKAKSDKLVKNSKKKPKKHSTTKSKTTTKNKVVKTKEAVKNNQVIQNDKIKTKAKQNKVIQDDKQVKNNKIAKKNKIILLVSILVIIILGALGITYAYSNFIIGTNQQLVLGDIYMHYKETNQLVLENAMPSSGINYVFRYVVNPVMETEETGTGILASCEDFFTNYPLEFDDGTTATTFCQGTGTIYQNQTIQDFIDYQSATTDFWDNMGDQLLADEVIFSDIDIYYTDIVINPIMQSEETGTGILASCEDFFTNYPLEFDDGTTVTTFCQGTGTYNSGLNFENYLNEPDAKLLSLSKKEIIFLENNMSYFEFTIDGTNTYENESIWYDIVLTYGDLHDSRSTRIRDDLLVFRLVEVLDDETEYELFSNNSYTDLTNQRIWVDTILPQETDVNRTYRLYMWISDQTKIGNTFDIDYTMAEWNDIFASIKVNVTGDLSEKTLDDSGMATPTYATDIITAKVNTGGLVAINNEGTLYEFPDIEGEEGSELNPEDYADEIREYRYSGVDVDNYVYFNCQDNDGTYDYGDPNYDYQNNCETWRIVGIFNSTYDARSIKIVKNDVLTSEEIEDTYTRYYGDNEITYVIEDNSTGNVYWNYNFTTPNANDWLNSSLQYYLNSYDDGEFYSAYGYHTGLKSTAASLLSYEIYNLGNVSSLSNVIDVYNQERNDMECDSSVVSDSNLASCSIWNGNQSLFDGEIALLYPSDYGYSSDPSYWDNTNLSDYLKDSEAYATSWMSQTMNHTTNEWLLSPSSSSNNHVITWSLQGNITSTEVQDTAYAVRPVVILDYDVSLVTGDGTKDTPYVFYYE